MSKQKWWQIRIVLACCTMATILNSTHLYIYHQLRNGRYPFSLALAESAADWYSWVVIIPLIIWFARRFPLTRQSIAAYAIMNFFATIGFALLHLLLHSVADRLLIHGTLDPTSIAYAFKVYFGRLFYFALLVCWLIVIGVRTFDYFREQTIAVGEMKSRLAQAQLQTLRMQLQPHFLFNTLHAISALNQEDPDSANQMIARLSEMLRLSLRQTEQQEVTLQEELDFLKLYLEIEKIRFRDRLSISMQIEPSTLGSYVPNLILQPLVENSINHGISRKRGPGSIRVSSSQNEGKLVLAVEDNGKGILEEEKEGIGLKTTRTRLKQMYGDDHKLELTNLPEGGFKVEMSIPNRKEPLFESSEG